MRSQSSLRRMARPRRGVALILTMILTVAFAALAMGAIYLTGNAALIGSSYDRERDYRYAAEAALGIAKSQLNGGLFVLPDSNYTQLMSGATITGADGLVLPRVLVNLYVGPTGSTSGQDGTFGSVVAEATDGSGARYVRRLELTQETFAKFAYFSVKEKTATGGTIYFGGNDVIFGPLFSNDTINILAGTCPVVSFRDQVQTARNLIDLDRQVVQPLRILHAPESRSGPPRRPDDRPVAGLPRANKAARPADNMTA